MIAYHFPVLDKKPFLPYHIVNIREEETAVRNNHKTRLDPRKGRTGYSILLSRNRMCRRPAKRSLPK